MKPSVYCEDLSGGRGYVVRRKQRGHKHSINGISECKRNIQGGNGILLLLLAVIVSGRG